MNQFRFWIREMKKDAKIPFETEKAIEDTLKALPRKAAADSGENIYRMNMRRRRYRVIAAACAVVLLAGSTAYASRMDFSLLTNFKNDSREVKERAQKLMETEVKQTKTNTGEERGDASQVSFWVTSKVKEAVCDKNTVLVELEVKPKDGEHYLLKPLDADLANDLRLPEQFDTELSVDDYAKSLGKTALHVSVGMDRAKDGLSEEKRMIDNLSLDYQMQPDGTVLFKLQFDNDDKTETLKYRYSVCVTRPDDKKRQLRDYFDFEIGDPSEQNVVHYVPVKKDQLVEGTHLIVEDVELEESDLSIAARVKYRYTGDTMSEEEWWECVDGDVMFFCFDEDGNPLKDDGVYSGGEGGELLKGKWGEKNSVYRDTIGLAKAEIKDTLVLRARGVFLGKKWFGEVTLRRAGI